MSNLYNKMRDKINLNSFNKMWINNKTNKMNLYQQNNNITCL